MNDIGEIVKQYIQMFNAEREADSYPAKLLLFI